MAKFDLNALTQPAMELTMRDENKTLLHLICPSEQMIERLQAGMAELKEVLAKEDKASVNACYQLAADLISENYEGIAVSVDDLRNKYGFNNEMILVLFFKAYLGFVSEIINAKN